MHKNHHNNNEKVKRESEGAPFKTQTKKQTLRGKAPKEKVHNFQLTYNIGNTNLSDGAKKTYRDTPRVSIVPVS